MPFLPEKRELPPAIIVLARFSLHAHLHSGSSPEWASRRTATRLHAPCTLFTPPGCRLTSLCVGSTAETNERSPQRTQETQVCCRYRRRCRCPVKAACRSQQGCKDPVKLKRAERALKRCQGSGAEVPSQRHANDRMPIFSLAA